MFQYNKYSALLLIGFIQGVVFAFLLWRRGRKEERLSDKLLALLLILCCAHIAQYMLGFGNWYDSRDHHSTFMFYFPFHNFLLIGPVIYFYFRSLTNHKFKLEQKHWWHFLPGLLYLSIDLAIFIVDFGILHWGLGYPLLFFYETKGFLSEIVPYYVNVIMQPITIIAVMVYITMTIIEYTQYRKYINNYFSATEEISFNWLRNLLLVVIIGITVNWGFKIADQFISMTYISYWNAHLAIATMIYFISIQGFIATHKIPQKLSFEPEAYAQVDKESKTTEKESVPELQKWKKKIEKIMKEQQPYLNPNLSLTDLAQQLSTNTSILSKVINTGFQQNFNDFINSHRVQMMQQKLQASENRQFTLTSLAYDCGFNSKATFNRAFKKFVGLSPKEYLNSLEQKATIST